MGFRSAIKKLFRKPVRSSIQFTERRAAEPPITYLDPYVARRKEGETVEDYNRRVPLAFQPVEAVKLSYRGKPL